MSKSASSRTEKYYLEQDKGSFMQIKWFCHPLRPSILQTQSSISGLIFTVEIASIIISLFAVHSYNFHIFTVTYSSLHGFIWDQHNGQLLVGLSAQLVERCTGIAEVIGSNPVQAWIFSGLIFTTAYVVVITAKIASIYNPLCPARNNNWAN